MSEPDERPAVASRESSHVTFLLVAILLLYIVFRAVICFVQGERGPHAPEVFAPPDCPSSGPEYAFERWVDDVEFHLGMGAAYAKRGLLDPAIFEYRRALRLAPRNAEAHRELGRLYGQIGLLEEAAAELKEALRSDPSDPRTRSALQALYAKRIEAASTPAQRRRLEEELAELTGRSATGERP